MLEVNEISMTIELIQRSLDECRMCRETRVRHTAYPALRTLTAERTGSAGAGPSRYCPGRTCCYWRSHSRAKELEVRAFFVRKPASM